MKDKIFRPEELIEMAQKLLQAGGLNGEDALTIAKDLVMADMRGLSSHGVSRIPMYLTRIRKKVVNPTPSFKVDQKGTAALLIDGDHGMGFLTSHFAVQEGIKLADKIGIAVVGVNNSTHFGMSASYIQEIVDAGYACMVFTNSSPALPVYGGRTAFLGAAPMAAGLPGGKNSPPYILDMAMTKVARGKIRVAATKGEKIPEDLALDKDGRPTTDAKEAFEGICLPFGGMKGAALAMLMDMMAGMFTGANYGGDVKSLYFDHSEPQNVGHIFFIMKRDLFVSAEEYDRRMDDYYARIKSLPRAVGFDEIFIPGEPEARKTVASQEKGITIPGAILDDLKETAELYNLSMTEYFPEEA